MPVATEPRSWENRRSALRHDWLKNTYLNRLDGFLSGLNAETPDREWLLEFIEEDLPAWEDKKDEARQVIDAYEEEMSPRTLLNRPPLSNCSSETQDWLGDLVHRLWRARYTPNDTTETARNALDDASKKYEQLDEQLDDAPSVAELKSLRPEFEAFRDACVNLGEAMSEFLNEVKVV
jgi:hypothetical protein